MAITVELWIDDQLVGGAEQWWDDIEAALPDDNAEVDFPMLSRVDPYGVVVFNREAMNDLAVEIRRFSAQVPKRVLPFLDKLVSLCDAGGQAARSELRFLGD